MALNQKVLKEKLDEYAKTQLSIGKLTKKRNEELDPFIKKHNEETKPITAKYAEKLSPLETKSSALAKEIETLLLANTDKDGNVKPVIVKAENATAQLSKSEGARVISVRKFFDLVEDKKEEFWNCFSVVINKAEKLIGKSKVDEISTKKTSYSVAIEINK